MRRLMAKPPTPLRRNRDFVLFQTGQLLSAVGTSTALIAFPLLTLAVTHSPAKAGVVSFAQFLPIVLFSLASGVAGDRVDRKRLMIASDILRAVAVGGLVAAILLHRLAFGQIVIVSFIEGTGGVFFGAGRSRRVQVDRPEDATRRGGEHGGGPAVDRPARRTAGRRRTLRGRPCCPVPRRFPVLRLLDALAVGDADAVPGAPRARRHVRTRRCPRGTAVRVGEPIPPPDD
jgi:hypothetical protein